MSESKSDALDLLGYTPIYGARKGIRTLTPMTLDPKTSASASFAIRACGRLLRHPSAMGFGAQGEIRTRNTLRQWLLRPPRLPKLRHLDINNRLLRTRLSWVLVFPAVIEPATPCGTSPSSWRVCLISPQEHIGGADAARTHAPAFADLAV